MSTPQKRPAADVSGLSGKKPRKWILAASAVAALFLASPAMGQDSQGCHWDPQTKELTFSLSRLSGILSCNPSDFHGRSHHFREVTHTPSGTRVSPDKQGMVRAGLLNYYRVLVSGGSLTELRQEEAIVRPEEDGLTLVWEPSIRLQARVTARFTFRDPNIIDMDLSVESLAHYPGFEILLSAYMGPAFEGGAYVAKKEFETSEPEQIRIIDQPMIHGIWPFFPRDEAGAHLLTDGRHQKGRFYWRMAIGRRYGMPLAFSSNADVDVLLMGRPEDVYAVGASYKGDPETDGVARHRSLYLSLFGEDFQPGEGRRTQMRMIIDDFGSDPQTHTELYQTFLDKVQSIPRSFWINP